MKKTILFSIAALVLGAGTAFATETSKSVKKDEPLKHDCGDCPMHKKAGARKCAGKMCPEKIAGVETFSKNTADGVEIIMTAAGKETIARVQELTVVHYGNRETMDKDCPGRVEGAEARIQNTADGVKVFITGKTTKIIKNIQEASAREHTKAGCPETREFKKTAQAAKKYICPMKCAEADKPGKCPKCGIQMEEKK